MRLHILALGLAVGLLAADARAQSAVLTHNTYLRRDPSTSRAPIRLMLAGEELTLLDSVQTSSFYRVRTSDSTEGWAWARNVSLGAVAAKSRPRRAPAAAAAPPLERAGSSTAVGCGDHLWRHVYNPQRLLIHQQCVTVTGVVVDATNGRNRDGSRHEKDGDTHGWIRLDPKFRTMLNAGNRSDEQGNLVFELVCHYSVSQTDAKPSCQGFRDHTVIPPIGTHVEISGTFVMDDKHAKWNEIHPVSSITAIP